MPPRRVTIRNTTAEANLFARRAVITFLCVIVMILILFSNIYKLEVIAYDKYQTRSNENRIKIEPVAPNRGVIYDRNGILLAENKATYSLELIPQEVEHLNETVAEVSELLSINEEKQKKFFKNLRRNRRFKPVVLHSHLTDKQVALFSVNQHKYPGVFIDARLKRFYPFADITTHSIGYVARINQKDKNKLKKQDKIKDYAATYDIGKLGIEKYYEDMLHGTLGFQKVEKNNQGRVIRTLDFTPPTPGKDLTLSLDIELQMIAKRALAGKRGAIVALDPRDGGILALYSNPSYDPNLFVHGISTTNYNKLLYSKDLPFINRTTQGYPPASTVKPFVGLLGLEEQVINQYTKIWDPGWYQLNGIERKYRDWKKWGHGEVNLSKAIEESCNVYFYDLAFKLGITKMSNFLDQFGFGDYTGIDIHEERKGILPSVEWKRGRYNQPWYTGETLSVGIGQSFFTATPIQLAQALSILVNKGEIKVPHLLMRAKQVITTVASNKTTNAETSKKGAKANGQNNLPFAFEPIINEVTKLDKNIINEDILYDEKPLIELSNNKNWDLILDAMHNTAQRSGATAYNAFKGSRYDVSGKTGSAQVAGIKQDEKYDAKKTRENKRDNAMFVSFAPYENPEIIVVVAIENVAKGGGASNAAPVARQIMDQYFGNRVITSTDPLRHPQHNKMYNQKKRK